MFAMVTTDRVITLIFLGVADMIMAVATLLIPLKHHQAQTGKSRCFPRSPANPWSPLYIPHTMTWYIPEELALYNWSLDWRVPVCSSLLYAIIVTFFSRRNSRRLAATSTGARGNGTTNPSAGGKLAVKSKVSEPWTLFRMAVVAHNVLLMVFSAYTFYSVTPLLLASFRFRSSYDAFCDHGGWVYRHGMGFWTWAFYMSKYYELLDTAILLAKGKPSSFLQTFHHAGAIISMWMLASTRAFGAWVFVCFNSFIHTIMYFYYTLTCFGYQPTWKRIMTYMQLTQFFVGLPLALAYLFVPKCVPEVAHPKDTVAKLFGVNGFWSQVYALGFTFSYVAYLIVLFLDFARRTYVNRKTGALGSSKKST